MKKKKRINWVAVMNMVGLISAFICLLVIIIRGVSNMFYACMVLISLFTLYLNGEYFYKRLK